MRATSFGRLPGQHARPSARRGQAQSASRNAARGADGRARSTSGWPTNSHRHAAARGRSPPRTERSPARDRRPRGSSSAGRRATPRSAGRCSRRPGCRAVLIRRASRKLKSGKSMTTSASGRFARAPRDQPAQRAAASCGTLAMASVRPVTASAAVVVDQAAAGGGELRPAEAGDARRRTSARSSRVSAPAYRSPDGSPHDSSRRRSSRRRGG